MSSEKAKLVTFQDLNKSPDDAFRNNEFKALLNKTPPEKWLKKNPMANNSRYLPIDKTEFLLDSIFQEWKIEVLREGVMFNSVYVVVRVHYKNPVDYVWYFHDGVGAKDLQKDAPPPGTKNYLSVETIKAAAVQMALPTAKSLAIKDACDHLGKLFGRDVNRKDTIEYDSPYTKPAAPDSDVKAEERLLQLIRSSKTVSQLEQLFNECKSMESRNAYDEKLKALRNS